MNEKELRQLRTEALNTQKELKQLQIALKNHQEITFARKAPRQMGLFTDFRGGQYRVDFVQGEGWRAKVVFGEGPDLAELQALIPVILKVQQDKEAEVIAKAEAAKAKEEAKQAKAEAEAETRTKKSRELHDACTRAFIPGFNAQEWAKEKFGQWNFGELALEELEILWAEMKRRAKEWQKNPTGKYLPVLPRLSWESEKEAGEGSVVCIDLLEILNSVNEEIEQEAIASPCPNCEGSGLCGGLIDGCECMGDCPNEDLCPECEGKGAIVPAPGEEVESVAIAPIDAKELAEELTLIFSADPNFWIRNVWETSLIVSCDAGFLVQIRDQGEGDWFCEDLTETAAEGWSLRFNICKEALSQACASIVTRKQKHAEALRMAPEQVAELMRRSKAGDEEADAIILNAMNECLGARCDEAFKEPIR